MRRVPRGIPSVTYCRILSPVGVVGTGDVLNDGNAITVLEPGKPSSRHEVAQVIERGVSDEETCEMIIGNKAGGGVGQSLNPISAFVNDAATTVLFIIGSKQTKKWQFLKKTVLPFVANELFSNIADKEHEMASNYLRLQINFSAFEVQDEVVTDLLRPANRGLHSSFSPEEGFGIHALHKETIADERELRKFLIDACDNRASNTLPVGASIDTSSAIFEFTLYQSEGNSGDSVRSCHSRLLVVEVPSTDPLALGDPTAIRQFEGVSLHKSLMAFADVARRLSTPSKATVAPFRASVLTSYLSELLGGNAIVVALGVLASGEPAVTRKTLEIISALNTAVHYPIGGRELTDVLQGLLCKYRSMVVQMQDELALRDVQKGNLIANEASVEKQLIAAQQELARAIVDKNEAIDDRAHVFEMAELLKAKYTTLMQEKLAQADQVLQLEEDKIALARELMDNRLETAALQEAADKEKFDLSKELLTAKNQIFELDNTVAGRDGDIEELKVQLGLQGGTVEALNLDVAKLNDAFSDKQRELDAEKEKNIELGAELLTLLNRRDFLQEECERLQSTQDVLQDKANQMQQLENNARDTEEELFQAKRHTSELEIALQRLQLELERKRLELQERASQPSESQPAPKSAAAAAPKPDPDSAERVVAQRRADKLLRGLEKAVARAQADLESVSRERGALEQQLTDLRTKYRASLSAELAQTQQQRQYHHMGGSDADEDEAARLDYSDTNSETSDSRPVAGSKAVQSMQLQQDLADSYAEREQDLAVQLDAALQQKSELKFAYRTLFDAYQGLLDFVQDNLQHVEAAALPVVTEKLKFEENIMANAEEYLKMLDEQQRVEFKEQLKRAELASVEECERMARMLKTYQKNLAAAETRLSASQQENVDMHIQIKQLMKESHQHWQELKQSQALNEQLRFSPRQDAHREDGGSPSKSLMSAEFEQRYVAMYDALTTQIQELKEQLGKGSYFNAPQPEPQPLSNNMPLDAVSLAEVPKIPRSPAELLRSKSSGSSFRGTVQPADDTINALKSEVAKQEDVRELRSADGKIDLRTTDQRVVEYIRSLESNASRAMSNQLRSVEDRSADLSAKNASLKEELQSYQRYMRDVVPQYKKQIQYLKTQLSIATGRKQSVAMVGGMSKQQSALIDQVETKLPSIH